jgi:hypothetical protein
MKKIIIVLICVSFLVSCQKATNSDELQIIDGCEYIVTRNGQGNGLTHKGNCNNPIHKCNCKCK